MTAKGNEMSLYAISDLHLALGVDKPMSIFGDHWDKHSDKIALNWHDSVKHDDTVLIPGDISWGMTLDEAASDLEFINSLPGMKIITKGNHDYWWTTVAKIEKYFEDKGFDTIKLLKNNFFRVDDDLVCGTRGWILPGDPAFSSNDPIVYRRETGRLEASLKSAEKVRKVSDRLIVMMHYPPLLSNNRSSDFTRLLSEYSADICLYGHVHLKGFSRCIEGQIDGVDYINISADKIAFKPLCV
ncbi:MAG: metallophosphoesterase [Eubacteriales bacterium]|nr:metallophosphoesterase [Eubacteriales bacterium]NCU26279.1 serine/threonine protein phosphatase [Candidatus Nomurabacteria bacterium]